MPPIAPEAPRLPGFDYSGVQTLPTHDTIEPTDSCIIEGLIQAGLTTLAAAIKHVAVGISGLDDVTILAPINSAFESLGADVITLPEPLLRALLQFHMLDGERR
jgi:uncharacterized surface protein with fasciclin (FAS1) repeats